MAWILLRDSVAGYALRSVCNWETLQYPEESDQFLSSATYQHLVESQKTELDAENDLKELTPSPRSHGGSADTDEVDSSTSQPSGPGSGLSNNEQSLENGTKTEASKTFVVSWYGERDPENPKNWPSHIKLWTHLLIYLYCFSVYMGASIATPAEPSLQQQFGITPQVSSLVLSIYVLGYGIGPL